MKVVRAAIRDNTGTVHSLPPPARHCDVLHSMFEKGIRGSFLDGQGFELEDGTFVNRVEAGKAAIEAGQIKELAYTNDELFSEDLW